MTGLLRGNNITAGTFGFVSKHPQLHTPAIRVNDMDLVDPNNSKCLLDGEIVRIGEATGDGGAVIFGTRRAFEIVTGNMPVVTVGGGAGDDTLASYVDGARAINAASEFRIKHGRRGRGDSQVFGAVPVVSEEDFQFNYRITDVNETYAPGVKLFVHIIPNANLPAYIRDVQGVSRDVVGLVPQSFIAGLGDAGINGTSIEAVAECLSSLDANGWVRCRWRASNWVIAGAVNP